VKSIHETSSKSIQKENFAALLHELSDVDEDYLEGKSADDGKWEDLAHSIRDVFAMGPNSLDTKPKAKVVPAPLPVEGEIGHINVSAAVVHVPPPPLRLPGKVGHINVSEPVNQTQVIEEKEQKTKAIEEAVVSMPLASLVVEEPKPVQNKTDEFPGNASQKAAWEKKEEDLEQEVEKLKGRLTNVSETLVSRNSTEFNSANASAAVPTLLPIEGKVGHINVTDLALKPHSVTQPPKLPKFIEGKVGHFNVSVPVNQTQVDENSTKAVEEVAVSLPMASLALEDPQPAENKTEPKFPGNASQKAAWEKKEENLEQEVETLKDRLTNASESLEASKPAKPATGTFSAQLNDAGGKQSDKFMAAKAPEAKALEPKAPEPILKDEKPRADWPAMGTVAAPVPVVEAAPSVAAVPPQKEAIQEEEGTTNKVGMGAAFTGTPATKAESVLALDAAVEHDAVVINDENSEQEASTSSPGWFSRFFSWLFGSGTPSSAVISKPPVASLAQVTTVPHKVWVKQDPARTAEAASVEHQHIIEVNDAWSDMEKEDAAEEDYVRREDVAERQVAETPELPHQPTKSELDGEGRSHVHMSGFWTNLEKQDYNIEQTVQSDDLVKYQELTEAQDTQVSKASDQVGDSKLTMEHSPVKHDKDWRLLIHEPWLHREVKDKLVERQVHDNPDLQMLQLEHRHRRK